jgi:hypothetical protein
LNFLPRDDLDLQGNAGLGVFVAAAVEDTGEAHTEK